MPNVGSRLQRLSIVALCMLLLCAATYCTASQQTQGASTTDMLSSSSSSAAGMQMPTTYSAASSSSTGTLISMTGAALPILLALFMVQVGQQPTKAIHTQLTVACHLCQLSICYEECLNTIYARLIVVRIMPCCVSLM